MRSRGRDRQKIYQKPDDIVGDEAIRFVTYMLEQFVA